MANLSENSTLLSTTVSSSRELKDEQVLKLSIDKPGFFSVLVDRHQSAFLRKAERILRNKEEAEDIVQETFTKIYINAGKFKEVPGASFKSWAYKILLNTTFSHCGKVKKEREHFVRIDEEFAEVLGSLNSDNPAKKEEIRDLVLSALSKIPTPLSKVLELHFLKDLPQAEIARMEGVSVSAIKTRIHRAKKEFRKIEPNFIL